MKQLVFSVNWSYLFKARFFLPIGELVIQFLLPLRIKTLSEGTYLAFVSIPPGSDPWLGSI